MATGLARKMVSQWVLSDKLGPLLYSENEQEIFLGRSVAQQQHVSDETFRLIDMEIRNFVDAGYDLAKKILSENLDDLHRLAEGALEYETLSGDDITKILAGKPLNRQDIQGIDMRKKDHDHGQDENIDLDADAKAEGNEAGQIH